LATFTCDANRRLSEETKVPDRRHLQAATTMATTTSAATTTATTMAATTTAAAEECVCETTPEIVTTFTSTLSFSNASELAALDFSAIKDAVRSNFPAGTTAVAVAVVKVAVSYTFPDNIEITGEQCKGVVATAYAVDANRVTVTPVAATRRLMGRRLATQMNVEIEYPEAEQDQAASAVENLPSAAFATALATLPGIDASAAAGVTASEPSVTVDIEFVVTGDAAIVPPTAAAMESVMADNGATITAVVSDAQVVYTIMPCSEATAICLGTQVMRPSPDTIGCAGALCTAAADRDTCCTVTGDAGGAESCVLGSLTMLALSCNFVF